MHITTMIVSLNTHAGLGAQWCAVSLGRSTQHEGRNKGGPMRVFMAFLFYR